MRNKNWELTRVANLCTRIGDGLHGTPNYIDNGEIYFVNGVNIKDGRICIFEETKKVSIETFKKNYVPLSEKTLLMSINGTLGNLAYYNGEQIMLGKSAAYLNFKSSINQFYYYYFQLPSVQEYFYNIATGSTIKNLGLKAIQDFQVPYPKEYEWKPIAKTLSDLDAKIALNNKINAELEAVAKLIYDYWFVQFDFPDENGKPYRSSGGKMVWNEGLKKEIPEKWEVVTLSELVLCNKWSLSKNNVFDYINYLDTSNITYNKVDTIQRINIQVDKVPSRAQRIIEQDDIVFSTVRPNQCHFGIIKKNLKNLIASSGFAQIRSKAINVSNDFIYQFLTSERTISRLQQIAETAVSAYPSISHNDILGLSICLPKDRNKLTSINSQLNSINLKVSNCLEENKKLSGLRDWLLPMLMNGQVTVADNQQKVETILNKKPSEEEYQKRKQIALQILSKSAIDLSLGKVKFEKLLHLCEYHIVKYELNQGYHQHAAGPYDPAFTHRFFDEVTKEGFAQIKKQGDFQQIVVNKAATKTLDGSSLSADIHSQMEKLINHFMGGNYEKPEIVSTLYAVWNNRIIRNELINDELLKQDFLAWSKVKEKYKDQLDRNLKWMRANGIVPDGWGKVIGEGKK